MIENLTVEGADVSFTINLTTPACPLKHRIEADARRAVMGVEGVSTVKIEMASKVRASTPVNIDANQFGHVIAVGSGKGGVGKSTIACPHRWFRMAHVWAYWTRIFMVQISRGCLGWIACQPRRKVKN